jgi:hypothetical protein
MTDLNKVVEQHILEHQSRLDHIDEMLERAREEEGKAAGKGEYGEELTALKRDRDELSDELDSMKRDPAEFWQKNAVDHAGPMGMWDAIAEQIEDLLERLQGKSKGASPSGQAD